MDNLRKILGIPQKETQSSNEKKWEFHEYDPMFRGATWDLTWVPSPEESPLLTNSPRSAPLVENHRKEEKEGAQTQNSTIGDGSSINTVIQTGSITASGGTIVNVFQGQGSSSGKRPLPVDIDDLDCTKLKRYFKDALCQASPLPWYPHDHAWNIHEVYTELALKGSVNNFGVKELFKQRDERFPEDASYRIFIEGDAGYGKSTLILKIASDWSNSDSNDKTNYTSRFSLLLVVKLGYVGEDENLLSYMESIYNEKMDKRLEDVLKSKGAEKVLILLDGYDEANANTKKEVDKIMKKEKMMDCHVVLTSRFGHAPRDVKSKALLVTVKGFGRKQVVVAVGKFFIKAGHLTKDDFISCVVEPVPLRDSDSDIELSDSDSEYQLNDSDSDLELKDWDSDNELIDSDSDNELSDSDSEYQLNDSDSDFKHNDSDSDNSIRIDQILNSDDFENVQEIFSLLPEEKRLGLDQFKKFMKKLQDDSPYKELAQCPLLCIMLCCLISECPNSELPSTCSGLYFAMINRNLYRAAAKKAETAGKVDAEWNLSALNSRIRKGHESYLQEFGRLCINGLKTRSMSISLFDITGNEEAAETTDVKVTRLIEAGVLVQDFTELNIKKKIPSYQVPHRTTAEFLAAYYLSGETDPEKPTNSLQQNLLLDLFRLKASFDEVAVSLIEMGKPRCLAGAFRAIKFSPKCLRTLPFMKSYFSQHGAAGTWSEFKHALPNKLQIKTMDHDITVSSSEPCLTLQLIEEFGKMNTGNTNALRSLLPKDYCLVSLHVGRTPSLPILLHTLVKSGVIVLNSLKLKVSEGEISDQKGQDVVRSLQELLKAGCCPVQLSFTDASDELILAVIEAMQEVPNTCRLTSFQVVEKFGTLAYTIPLSKVLAEKWLSNLQHLGIALKYTDNKTEEPFKASPSKLPWDSQWGGILNPILKGLSEPGCSLTSLNLCNFDASLAVREGPLLENLLMLSTKLVTLRLEGMDLHFDVTRISKYALREKCSLKSLHLKSVTMRLDGVLPSADENKELGWRNVALYLEEFTINRCEFPVELLSWLNLSVPNLRTLSIGRVVKMPNDDTDSYANQLLEALTRSSRDRIEELSLLQSFWRNTEVLMLHPIREALQRCPRMRKVKLEILGDSLPKSIGPDPSTPLSSSDKEALKSENMFLALLKIVLSVPMLQTLTSEFFFEYWRKIGTFCAIADMANKWQGKSVDNECNTLTLHGLSNENACHAMHVFRKLKLKYRLKYVSDKVYELSFPLCKMNI